MIQVRGSIARGWVKPFGWDDTYITDKSHVHAPGLSARCRAGVEVSRQSYSFRDTCQRGCAGGLGPKFKIEVALGF